jgi:hypothetical protein
MDPLISFMIFAAVDPYWRTSNADFNVEIALDGRSNARHQTTLIDGYLRANGGSL